MLDVESPESTLDYPSDHRPDVIFMDHLMSGTDGLVTYQLLGINPCEQSSQNSQLAEVKVT